MYLEYASCTVDHWFVAEQPTTLAESETTLCRAHPNGLGKYRMFLRFNGAQVQTRE